MAWQGLLGPCEVVDGPASDIPDPPESDDEGDEFWGVQGTAGRYLSVDASWMTPELVDYPALWSMLAQKNKLRFKEQQKLPDDLYLTLMLVRESDGKVATIIKDFKQAWASDIRPNVMNYRFDLCPATYVWSTGVYFTGHFGDNLKPSMIMRASHTKILTFSFGVMFECPEFPCLNKDDIEDFVSSLPWQDVDEPPLLAPPSRY